MRNLKRAFHFLGGVAFAILLIGLTALFVIAGTFLESMTDSHRYAASFTYRSPLFIGLLGLFFVNILFASLRRWPFKAQHGPFLITHLGLLMLLAGAIGKQLFGLQGNLSVVEGSGREKVLLAETYALEVTSRKGTMLWPLPSSNTLEMENCQIRLLDWRKNSRERLEFWIKGSQAHIKGLPPLAVTDVAAACPQAAHVAAGLVRLGEDDKLWKVYALRTENMNDLASSLYLEDLRLVVSNAHTGQILGEAPLKSVLEHEIVFEGGVAKADLSLSCSPIQGLEKPQLILEISPSQQIVSIPLSWDSSPPSTAPFRFSLVRPPSILFVEDSFGDNQLWIFDAQGRIGSEVFRRDALETLIAYDEGYRGYAIESRLLPMLECALTRRHHIQPAGDKWEDNLPLALLKVSGEDFEEKMPLTFDRSGAGMRWPLPTGQHVVRLQPMTCRIPYRVRLHDARQISYPNSSQPYSYEAWITVTDRRDGSSQEVILSMNRVHETRDGYRFYLASIAPPSEGAVRQIQIVVNHDPVKYWLTYPGAFALVLGIILLFMRKR